MAAEITPWVGMDSDIQWEAQEGIVLGGIALGRSVVFLGGV